MPTSARYALNQLVDGQATAATTANEYLAALELVANGKLTSTLSTPPGSPVNGDLYIVGAGPTGAWTGKAGYLAYYLNGWKFIAPSGGMRLYDVSAKEEIAYSSVESAWYPVQDRWSTTEHWTGKYIGANKLYAKVVTFGAGPNTTVKTVAHGVSSPQWTLYTRIEASFGITSVIFATVPFSLLSGPAMDISVDATNITVTSNFDASSGTVNVRLVYAK